MPYSDYWRSGCHLLVGFFSRLVCALGFPFYLGPLSPVYLLVTAQGLAAYSCFTTQSFWYSLKDLLSQLSASISSLVVSVYSEFMSTFVPPLHLQCWRTGFSLLWVLIGTRFWVLAVSVFFRTYLKFNFLARFHLFVSYLASVSSVNI